MIKLTVTEEEMLRDAASAAGVKITAGMLEKRAFSMICDMSAIRSCGLPLNSEKMAEHLGLIKLYTAMLEQQFDEYFKEEIDEMFIAELKKLGGKR